VAVWECLAFPVKGYFGLDVQGRNDQCLLHIVLALYLAVYCIIVAKPQPGCILTPWTGPAFRHNYASFYAIVVRLSDK